MCKADNEFGNMCKTTSSSLLRWCWKATQLRIILSTKRVNEALTLKIFCLASLMVELDNTIQVLSKCICDLDRRRCLSNIVAKVSLLQRIILLALEYHWNGLLTKFKSSCTSSKNLWAHIGWPDKEKPIK